MSRRNKGSKGQQSETAEPQTQAAPDVIPEPEVQASAPPPPPQPAAQEDPFAHIPTHQTQPPAPPSSTDLGKIKFADEEPEPPPITREQIRQEIHAKGGGGSGHHAALKAMRDKALQVRKKERDNIGAGGHKHIHIPEPRTPEEDLAAQARRFRVLGTPPPVRASGRTINLYEGKELDENNYDVEQLKRAGVKLQPIVAG